MLNSFFEVHQKKLFRLLLGLVVICSLLLFDLRLSMGGDDAEYIARAMRFLNEGAFPTYQGPLYPMILSLLIWLFDAGIGALKLFSLLFMVGHFILFYRAFKSRLEPAVFWSSLVIVSVNQFILYYASQTYSEAFFMLIQALFFWYFLDRFVAKDKADSQLVLNDWKKWLPKFLVLGCLLLALSLTRSVGFAALPAVVLFFLLIRRRKDAGIVLITFFILQFGFKTICGAFWDVPQTQFATQAESYSWVDPYNQSLGKEETTGYAYRYIDNSNLYLSKHLVRILGLRSDGTNTTIPALTILIYVLFLTTFILVFRKNRTLLFVGLYVAASCGVTFLMLQAYWDNDRLIVPFVPLILIFLLSGIHLILQKIASKQSGAIAWGVGGIFVIATLISSVGKIVEHSPVRQASMDGNELYGFEDWRTNYINVCKYVSDEIPESAIVGARKPSMAMLYSGRPYVGIRKTPAVEPKDVFLPNKAYLLVKTLDSPSEFRTAYLPRLKTVIYGYGPKTNLFPGNVSYQVYEFETHEIQGVEQAIEKAPFPYTKGETTFLNSFQLVSCVDPDEVAGIVHKTEMNYVILDQLRLDGKSISETTYRFVTCLISKYPDAIELVHSSGDEILERSSLYKIHRDRLPKN